MGFAEWSNQKHGKSQQQKKTFREAVNGTASAKQPIIAPTAPDVDQQTQRADRDAFDSRVRKLYEQRKAQERPQESPVQRPGWDANNMDIAAKNQSGRLSGHGMNVDAETFRKAQATDEDRSRHFNAGVASIGHGLLGSVPAITETLQQWYKNHQNDLQNAEWQKQNAELKLRGKGLYRGRLEMEAGIRQPGWDDFEAQLKRREEASDNTPVDQSLFGQRHMARQRELQAYATEDLSGFGKFLANTGISIGANLPGIGVGILNPAAGLGIMGVQATAQKAAELNARGIAPDESFVRSAISGTIETATEKIPLHNLVDIIKAGGGKSFVKTLMRQSGIEATEESAAYVLNFVADEAAADPTSQWSWMELLQAAGAGAISGGVFATGGFALNNALGNASAPQYNDIKFSQALPSALPGATAESIIPKLAELGAPSPLAQKQAEIIAAIVNNNRPISGNEAATIATSPQAIQVLTELTGQAINTNAPISEVKGAIRALPAPQATRLQEEGNFTQRPENVPTAQQEAPRTAYPKEAIRSAAATLGKNGQKAMSVAYDGTIAPDVFFPAFAQHYNAGLNGKPQPALSDAITKDQAFAAFSSGTNDAATSAQNQTGNQTQNQTGKPNNNQTGTKPEPARNQNGSEVVPEKQDAHAYAQTLPKKASTLFHKWAANEYVNIDLSDNSRQDEIKAYINYFDKWFNAGKAGTRSIDVKREESDFDFPPFLEEVIYRAGKEAAEAAVPKPATKEKPAKKPKTKSEEKPTENPKEEPTAPAETSPKKDENASAAQTLANALVEKIKKGVAFNSAVLYKAADEAYNGTMANGTYTPKDAFDALELAVNQHLLENVKGFNGDAETAVQAIQYLQNILNIIPTQTNRTDEQITFQQFSTPPNIAYIAGWVANVSTDDVALEPSAGIGGLALFPKAWGASVVVNELSERRLEILKTLGFNRTYNFNAEQINNILPDDVKPSLVIMNPPFSSTAGRTTTNKTSNAIRHVEQALLRLENNGRLVAILGQGMADNSKTFKPWWNELRKKYNIRANISVDGTNYKKYGTTFGIQLVVIDKTGPQTGKTITGEYKDLLEIPKLLEGIRNDRTRIEGHLTADNGSNVVGVHSENGIGGRGNAGSPVRSASVGGSERPVRSDNDGGRSPTGGNLESIQQDGASPDGQGMGESGGGLSGAVHPSVGPNGADRPETKPTRPISLTEQKATQNDDGVFADYAPPELPLKNTVRHPGVLVESAAMAAVKSPQATYIPNLPKNLIESGDLSDSQLANIIYAGQAHTQLLPGGERKGYFIGDGTGVGKGRQIGGILLDNIRQGRTKAVWISEKPNLFADAQRDWSELGQDKKDLFEQSSFKMDAGIAKDQGIVFGTYKLLTMQKNGKSRLDQLANWLGKEFDGVIAFDEAHNMGNLLGKKGKMGSTKPSQMAIAAVKLQELLPNARVVYASATAATDVNELAYAQRLGLWGRGTQFSNVNDFVAKIGAGGLAAMELVARDMKSMGIYQARSVTFDGVEYETLKHDLSPIQTEIYNTMCQAWQVTLTNINEALKVTGAEKNSRARSNAMSAYYGAMQRFYNQILTSMAVPSVIADIKKELEAGRSCVLQIVNTNQAESERQLAKAKDTDTDLDDLDLTPRGTLVEMVMKSFPIHAYEEYEDDNGKKGSRPVVGADGNPVIDKEAVSMRDDLIARINEMRVPDGPLEMLFDAFGTEQVAEMTGRTRRIVPKVQDNGQTKRVEESFTTNHKAADVQAFQDGKKRILIFSGAGGTGKSYHADKRAKNQQQRVHYLLQAGWSAPKAVQGFGRTNRTNQANSPIYKLVTTNIMGQKRFISTIARRLDQLGAITKGQRQTGSGMFGAKDNLESNLARDSLRNFYEKLGRNQIEGVDGESVFKKMGLWNKFYDEYGNFNMDENLAREMSTFLNRILVLEVDEQNAVFSEFSRTFEANYDRAVENGTVDLGLENVKADKIEVIDNQVVRTDEATGATTNYVQAKVSRKPTLLNSVGDCERFRDGFLGMFRTDKGDVRAVYRTADKTTQWGQVTKMYRLQSPVTTKSVAWTEEVFATRTEKLEKAQWTKEWKAEVKKAPEYVDTTIHMLTGTLLPVWNRLPEGNTRVMRLISDDGKQYLGRVIQPSMIDGVLRSLGAGARTKVTYTPAEIIKIVMADGSKVKLLNDRTIITRRRVNNEYRMEITSNNAFMLPRYYPEMIVEVIRSQRRYFIPTGKVGEEILAKLTKDNPVFDIIENNSDDDAENLTATSNMESSSTEGRWKTERVGVDKETMRLSDLIEKIQHDFGIHVTTGHIRGKGTLGQYNNKSYGIRTKVANYLPTVTHELGHHLDNTYGITKELDPILEKELVDMLPDETKEAYPEHKWKKEGLAEFVRLYLQNAETAAIDYPAFTVYFRHLLSERDRKLLDELADEVNAYYSLDATTAASSIRFREEGARDFRGITEKLKDLNDVFYQRWVDANHGISLYDKATGANTYKLASNSSYADCIAHSLLVNDLTDMHGKRVGDGLEKVLSGINLKDKNEYRAFGEYLVVKHGPERLAEGMRVFADERKNSTNWMNNRRTELEQQYPEFQSVSEKLYAFQTDFLDTWGVKTGLVSPESVVEWKDRWEYYVPFNRSIDKDGTARHSKKGYANQTSTIKRAKGSGLDIVHPVDNIINNMVMMVNAGLKNNVMVEITKAAKKNDGTATFLEQVPTPMKPKTFDSTKLKDKIRQSTVEAGFSKADEDKVFDIVAGIEDILIQYGRGQAHGDVVTVLKNGTPEFWKINDALLLSSITSMTPQRLPVWLELYGEISKFMTVNLTGINVVWSIFSNMPRDIMTYITYSTDRNPLKIFSGIGYAYLNKLRPNRNDPLYKEYLAMGGGKTSVYTADIDLAKRVRRKLSESKLHWLNPIEWVEFIADTVELGPRFSYYRILRQKGLSAEEAFFGSTDITVNFRRGGVDGRSLNKIIPFFGASVQGVDKYCRWQSGADAPAGKRKQVVFGRAAGMMAVSLAIASLLWWLNSGDDDERKQYAQLSNYTKNNFWCFPLGDGEYFTIPKPRELGAMSTLFEASMEYFDGGNKYAFDDMGDYLSEMMLPNVVSDIAKGDIPGAIGSLGIVGVGAYMIANRDFMGRPIVSESMKQLEPKDQFTDRTSKLAYWMGQAFNTSPQMLDYFFQQTLGGFWKSQKALFPVGNANRDFTLGVANTYVRDSTYSTDLINRLYEGKDKTEKAKNSNPKDTAAAIEAKLYSNMATFYSRYNKLSKADTKSRTARETRQIVLDMVDSFLKTMDGGERNMSEKNLERFCDGVGSTEFMPSVMDSTIKVDKREVELSASEYVQFQADYLSLYWRYVPPAISSGGAKPETATRRAKKNAADEAKQRAFSKHGMP